MTEIGPAGWRETFQKRMFSKGQEKRKRDLPTPKTKTTLALLLGTAGEAFDGEVLFFVTNQAEVYYVS